MSILRMIISLFALVAAGAASPTRLERRNVAKMVACVGARPNTMSLQDKVDTIAEFALYESRDWKVLTELPGRRQTFFAHDVAWRNDAEGWDHCRSHCLIPAATYGFDSALCRLSGQAGTSNVAFGYSPILPPESICNDTPTCIGRLEPYGDRWRDVAYRWALRARDGTKPDLSGKDKPNQVWYIDSEHKGPDFWAGSDGKAFTKKYNPNVRIICCKDPEKDEGCTDYLPWEHHPKTDTGIEITWGEPTPPKDKRDEPERVAELRLICPW